MINKVVIFGDSFNYGHGCPDRIYHYDERNKQIVGTILPENSPSEYCWGSLLQQKYPELTVLNYANPGRSNQHIFRDFLTYSENDKGDKQTQLIIFQLTNPDRIEIASHDEKNTASYVLSMAGNHHDHGMGDAVRQYLKYMYHESIGQNLGMMTLLSAYSLATLQKYNFRWSFCRRHYVFKTYDFVSALKPLRYHQMVDIRNYDFSGKYDHSPEAQKPYRAIDNHINEVGHQKYFDRVVDPIIKNHK
jgi:hypothetical protein